MPKDNDGRRRFYSHSFRPLSQAGRRAGTPSMVISRFLRQPHSRSRRRQRPLREIPAVQRGHEASLGLEIEVEELARRE